MDILLQAGMNITDQLISKCIFHSESMFEILLKYYNNPCKIIEVYNAHIRQDTNNYVKNYVISSLKMGILSIDANILNRILCNFFQIGPMCLSLDDVVVMINAGANPRYECDRFLHLACIHCDISVIKYFIYDCGCSTDRCISICVLHSRTDLFKFFLDMNVSITPDNIRQCIQNFCHNPQYLLTLVEHGTDIQNVSTLVAESIPKPYASLIKYLVQNNVNLNQLFMNLVDK